ncbi:MAG: sensor histidine kinase [Methylomonas sp.]|nr:sensor histidine kinase [Methylomonas sp.]
MTSLRKRLGRGLITVLCLVFVIHWLAADWVIRSVAEKQMANRLMDDSYSLMETLAGRDDDSVGFNSFHVSSVYNRPMSGHYYLVKVDALAYSSPSLSDFPLEVSPIGPFQSRLYHLDGPEGRPLLVFGTGLVKFGHRINISVAEDLSAVDHDITAIRVAYMALTLVVLVCAIALQRWDISRATRPLLDVGSELERVAMGHQDHIAPDVPVEIQPLVLEINRLLLLVERRLQQSRTAIGNLAHALKTPIAMLFKVAEHPAFDAYPELQRQMHAQNAVIHRCIERELKRARIAGNRQSSTVFNPRREAAYLVRVLENIYGNKVLDIVMEAPDADVHFDREDMLELLGNLLDNACKWAEQRVRLAIAGTDTLTVEVADDGPGCSEADCDALTQRGLRLDESVQGHGLGLAIVADIVDVYHGELRIGRCPDLGGLLVEVSLPLRA